MREVRAENLKPTLEQVQKAWQVWRNPGQDDYHEFIICLGDRLIGEIGYKCENSDQRTFSVDIKIGDPSLWGQGLGTEAVNLFVSYIFNQLYAQYIIARPGDWNIRSIRLFEKCGFREIRREEILVTDVHDSGIMVTMQRDKG
jgi:RimJ/RimL family protein N-acetyltransferase